MTTTDQHDGEVPVRRSVSRLLPVGLAVVAVALAGGLVLGQGMASGGPQRVTDAVSLGFVRDMSVHHAQAVRMSEVAHRRSSDPELSYLAFDILSTQQGQIGIMTGWLDLWEQGQSGSEAPMAWMGHEGPMPGMASGEELAQLDALPVPQMEELWLRLMIRHHRGAVPMAEDAAARADDDGTAALAASMSAGQQSEVELMERMLAERGLAPEPAPATPAHAGH
jgi:uncharacterized protein (DUF305 family)